SLRRSRVIVTETMLLNGSTSSHTRSSSSSALTSAPLAASSSSRIPNSFRVRDTGLEPRPGSGEGSTHLVTVNRRQVTVEDDHVVRPLRGRLHGGGPVMDGVHCQTGLTKPLSDPPGKGHMVLDHQHPHRAKYAPRDVTSVRPRR